ncbi:MAG: helix-turn-helix transcriptional regulator [Oscillospiraceae bacterium]|nr:helix-turn-helix transcriptional regulator [Oscillospiraceae bacterium]
MIIIIDSNVSRIRTIEKKYAGCHSCVVVQTADQLLSLAISERPVAVIAEVQTLSKLENSWANLLLFSRDEVPIVLLAKDYSRRQIEALNVQSIRVLDPDADMEELEYIIPTGEKTVQPVMPEQPKNLSRLRDHMFSNLLDGTNMPEDQESVMNLLGLTSETDKYYLAFVVSFSSVSKEWLMENVWETALRIQEITREEISKIVINRSCIRSTGRIAFVILMRQPGDEFRYVLESVLEVIQKRIAKECGKKIAIGVGTAEVESIQQSYRQACDALDQGRFFGNSFVCFYCDLFACNTQRFQLSQSFKEQIARHIYREEMDEVDKMIEGQLQQIYDLGLATRDNILALKVDVAVFLMDMADKLAIIGAKPNLYTHLINDFLTVDSLMSLEVRMKQYLREMVDTANMEQDKRTSWIARNAQAIIHGCIGDPINVQLLAQRLRISPNYLSAVFKSETGMRLTEYITNVKMQEAARLIRETQRSVAEISVEVGYENANYFSSLFKKQYGVTPSEYRMNNGSSNNA